jgi:hypothetical protein
VTWPVLTEAYSKSLCSWQAVSPWWRRAPFGTHVKVKVKLFLYRSTMPRRRISCFIKHHAMKAYWESGGIVPRILNVGTDGSESWASRPGCFIPGVRASGTHWVGGGGIASLDAVAKRKKFHHRLCRELNPGRPTRSLAAWGSWPDVNVFSDHYEFSHWASSPTRGRLRLTVASLNPSRSQVRI